MLIAVDIGNSSINIGYFTGKDLLVQRIDTHPLKDSEEYLFAIYNFLQQNRVEKNSPGGIISSVVPSHTPVLFEVLRRLSGVEKEALLTVSHKMHSGLKFKVDAPESVGTDRIVNAVAASEFYGTPVAIVDFGTATTISVVGREGDFVGGSILPGVRLMNRALDTGTSQLQEVVLEAPQRALGVDSAGCIRSGLFYGTAGACERILAEIEEETGFGLKLVLTGGYAPAVGGFLKRTHEINLNLTLEGLRILYGKNRPS
jgi:type III pantothenate kinase